jgi:hypothetical protein
VGFDEIDLKLGGYIMQLNPYESGDKLIYGTTQYSLYTLYPSGTSISTNQLEYLQNLFLKLKAISTGSDSEDFLPLIDAQSFMKHFFLQEFSRNIDGYTRSTYMHKFRNGPLRAGPIWDLDIAYVSLT